MTEVHEREQQNENRLDDLASKVTALRGVTVDIYDNARNQEVIDSSVFIKSIFYHTNDLFSSLSTSIKGSATRLGRMAKAGDKIAVLKLAGIISAAVVLLYWIWHMIF